MQLEPRAQTLLKALVERYIADGQPVGSRALSKFSGLDLSPATIRNIMADLEGEGENRALTALYEGETEGRGLEAKAKARRKEGKNAKIGGFINGAANLLGAGSTMADRYGS